MRKQVEPNIELVLVNLRAELERLVAKEVQSGDISIVFGERTIQGDSESRVSWDQFRTQQWEVYDGGEPYPLHPDGLKPIFELEEANRSPATAGSGAAVSYMCWRDPSYKRLYFLDFVPKENRRADYVAAALVRLADFCSVDEGLENTREVLQCIRKLQPSLKELFNSLVNDENHWLTCEPEDPKLIEAVSHGLDAVRTLDERLDGVRNGEHWTRLLGRHAVDEKSRKPIWDLDRLDRMRHAIFAIRERLFDVIESDEEVEALVPDGEGGDRRKRLCRVRSHRSRHLKATACKKI